MKEEKNNQMQKLLDDRENELTDKQKVFDDRVTQTQDRLRKE